MPPGESFNCASETPLGEAVPTETVPTETVPIGAVPMEDDPACQPLVTELDV